MVGLDRFLSLRFESPETGISLDLSRSGLARDAVVACDDASRRCFAEMVELEAGAIANADEGRRVGHYWLRAPELAPGAMPGEGLGDEIRSEREAVSRFCEEVVGGRLLTPSGARFTRLCLCGIGGSALGPQLLVDCLGEPDRGLAFTCLDNTDPDGIDRTLRAFRRELATTLFLVVSKSGGTAETRNTMLEARARVERADLVFARQACAVTGRGSTLDELAAVEGWLARFALEDFVGGRTSWSSPVGLLPAGLAGIDADSLLDGAAAMDRDTRRAQPGANLAFLLARSWQLLGEGRGERAMVVLPYRDRLALLGRYLQQLCMESLGKARRRDHSACAQGLTVYGNKGSTDQHAFVQQLRDGRDDFFACFVRALEDGGGAAIEVAPGLGSADWLQGFWLGTREALFERGRPSLTITLPRVDEAALGALLALFERAVGFYASLVDVNAYDQPGVEAGKKAAARALELRARILDALGEEPIGAAEVAERVAERIAERVAERVADDAEACLLLLEHLAANEARTGVRATPEGFVRGG